MCMLRLNTFRVLVDCRLLRSMKCQKWEKFVMQVTYCNQHPEGEGCEVNGKGFVTVIDCNGCAVVTVTDYNGVQMGKL